MNNQNNKKEVIKTQSGGIITPAKGFDTIPVLITSPSSDEFIKIKKDIEEKILNNFGFRKNY